MSPPPKKRKDPDYQNEPEIEHVMNKMEKLVVKEKVVQGKVSEDLNNINKILTEEDVKNMIPERLGQIHSFIHSLDFYLKTTAICLRWLTFTVV